MAQASPKSVHVVLAGASGVPGRYILKSLQTLLDDTTASNPAIELKLTVLKRANSQKVNTRHDVNYETAYVGDFNNIPILSQSLQALDPDIVISALKAEPSPMLDNQLVDALLLLNRSRTQAPGTATSSSYATPEQRRASYSTNLPSLQSLSLSTSSASRQQQQVPIPSSASQSTSSQYTTPNRRTEIANSNPPKKILFISGYTLDLLHPSIPTRLPPASQSQINSKVSFAHRLQSLAEASELEYVTVVNAAFLDYTLMKGYLGIDLSSSTATLFGPGDRDVTGCSLRFVGDVVSLLVAIAVSGDKEIYDRIRNQRLRVAETIYSGRKLIDVVQGVTGKQIKVTQTVDLEELRRQPEKTIRYLNWAGEGASTFVEDGLGFGAVSRRSSTNAGAGGGVGASSSSSLLLSVSNENRFTVQRRSLEEIVRQAIEDGPDVF